MCVCVGGGGGGGGGVHVGEWGGLLYYCTVYAILLEHLTTVITHDRELENPGPSLMIGN